MFKIDAINIGECHTRSASTLTPIGGVRFCSAILRTPGHFDLHESRQFLVDVCVLVLMPASCHRTDLSTIAHFMVLLLLLLENIDSASYIDGHR